MTWTRPTRSVWAGRILQMGDVVGLVERAERAMDLGEQAQVPGEGDWKGEVHAGGFPSRRCGRCSEWGPWNSCSS